MLSEINVCQDSSKRTSDVSTVDMEPEECDSSCHLCMQYDFSAEIEYVHLFNQISDEQKTIYSTLQDTLKEIYCKLDMEIEPVSIRDECSLSPKPVSLCNISNSCLTRRRLKY